MSNILSGKVIVVTGCSSGIGRAIALECAQQEAKLVLHYLGDPQSSKDMESLRDELANISNQNAKSPQTVEVAVNVTQPDAGDQIVKAAVSMFGAINGIVHNAGTCQFEDFLDVTRPQLTNHMDVNFNGPFAITQAVIQQMIKQKSGGSIVCIASISASMGSERLTHYASTKAAILGLNASLAVAFGKQGIRFNCVSPGTIETSMNKQDLAGPKRLAMEGRVPLGRLGVPEDIAKPVVFFLSDMAQYVSGQNLIVDGGSSVFYQ
ncbi:short-chain dehydrogenase/reductase SDR [Fusarium sp. MPI-SDFR-AT-0072]|nr:short-chain dehydrogenase/reductase SDR [Fusarium sp. MPI-SDFR-AT-0072]